MKMIKRENGLTSTMKNDPPYHPDSATIKYIKVLSH